MASPNVRDIINDIRKGVFNPVYILIGQETYFIDLILNALEKTVVKPEDMDFNYNIYYGQDANADVVVNCAQQFPVMAPKKLVILKEAQALFKAKEELDKIVPYVGNPNPNTVFVITYTGDKVAAITNLEKAASKNGGIVFKSVSPRDYELPTFIRDYCRANNVSIDDKSVQLLCEYVGLPLSKMFGEINKLFLIKGDEKKITPDDIEKHIGISKDFNNFELLNALVTRDYPKCIAIINYYHNNPKKNPVQVTLAVIFNYFCTLVQAHFLPQKNNDSLYTLLNRKNQRGLDELKKAMQNYPPVKAVNAIHHIREFDAKSKGVNSAQDPYNLLLDLIFKIMT